MGTTALVSGRWRLRAVAEALEQMDFDVLRADDPDRIRELCAGLGPEAVDCYVQLPHAVAPRQGRTIEQVGEFLTQGLLARFAAAAAVVPTLRWGATVVLVAGHEPPGDLPDAPPARRDLLAVLGRAVARDIDLRGGRTVVTGSQHSPADIAEIARSRGAIRGPDPSLYAAVAIDGTYDDWRREALSLPGPDVTTWTNQPSPDDYDW